MTPSQYDTRTPQHTRLGTARAPADLGWLAENLDVFSAIASLAFEEEGRGAIVVDVTSQPVPGAGHPFAYFTHETIEKQDLAGPAHLPGQGLLIPGNF